MRAIKSAVFAAMVAGGLMLGAPQESNAAGFYLSLGNGYYGSNYGYGGYGYGYPSYGYGYPGYGVGRYYGYPSYGYGFSRGYRGRGFGNYNNRWARRQFRHFRHNRFDWDD